MAVTDTQESKRPIHLRRRFLHDSGEISARAGIDVNTVIFVLANDKEIRFNLADICGGSLPAPCVGRAAMAFGVNTSAGNTIGTLDKDDNGLVHPDDVEAAVRNRLATFADGRWTTESAAGPGSSLLLEAIIKYRTEVNKKEASPDWLAGIRKQLDEDKDFSKKLLADTSFRAVHEQLKSERAVARAKAAAEKAQGSTALEI